MLVRSEGIHLLWLELLKAEGGGGVANYLAQLLASRTSSEANGGLWSVVLCGTERFLLFVCS